MTSIWALRLAGREPWVGILAESGAVWAAVWICLMGSSLVGKGALVEVSDDGIQVSKGVGVCML